MPRSDPAKGISVQISPGELIDKITILEIKAARISDPGKLENVRYELGLLRDARARDLPPSAELTRLEGELKTVNEALWRIEDDLRDCEKAGDFGPRFVALARSVYRTNDPRTALKRKIGALFGSPIVEEKFYSDY